jgi:TetR/AcrR family transcriptional regulator, cholesterol catabolism regulator
LVSAKKGQTDPLAPTNRRRKGPRNEIRLEEIVRGASELFAEKGYSATTLDDIAASVGLLAGSLYYYITSKEDLLYEFAKRVAEQMNTLIGEEQELQSANALARMTAFLERSMRSVENLRLLAGYNYLTSSQFMKHDLQLLEADRLNQILAIRHELQDFVAKILQQGIEEGSFDPDMNPALAGSIILRNLWSTASWYDPSGSLTYDEIAAWYKVSIVRSVSRGDNVKSN